ncbi:MAG: helix-turn-helix transcriptional regulator [Clostridia bacterium]|nr:helix-turn-helix transcriptional regulator [Clostridia bacterium]
MKNKINTDLIIIYLNKNNMTKKEFLHRTGITANAFNKVMKNDGDFKLTTLFSISRELNVSVKNFFS